MTFAERSWPRAFALKVAIDIYFENWSGRARSFDAVMPFAQPISGVFGLLRPYPPSNKRHRIAARARIVLCAFDEG